MKGKSNERKANKGDTLGFQPRPDQGDDPPGPRIGGNSVARREYECPLLIEVYLACLEVFFSLQQKPSPAPDEWPEWTEMDGQYYVSVNVETGVIENVVYDSGLNGNG